MSCCGATRRGQLPSTDGVMREPTIANESWFESTRDQPLTVYGPATGRAYRFTHLGDRLLVHSSDRLVMLTQQHVKEVQPTTD